MSKCSKGACWTRFLPHNWLCLKGLSRAFLVLFYLSLLLSLGIAGYLCSHIWDVFYAYLTPASNSELLSTPGLWEAWGVILLQVAAIEIPTALMLLAYSKGLKALAKIKQAVAPCCCQEEAEKPAKKSKKEDK